MRAGSFRYLVAAGLALGLSLSGCDDEEVGPAVEEATRDTGEVITESAPEIGRGVDRTIDAVEGAVEEGSERVKEGSRELGERLEDVGRDLQDEETPPEPVVPPPPQPVAQPAEVE